MKHLMTFLLLAAFAFLSSPAGASAPLCRALFQALEQKTFKLQTEDFAKFDEPGQSAKLILDPQSVNNEKKAYLFKAALEKGKEGALLGLGGDVNLSLAAMGRHKAMYLYDMDPRVIAFHQLIQLAMKESATAEQFIDYFASLQRLPVSESKKMQDYLSTLSRNSDLRSHFTALKDARDNNGQLYTFLATPENYNHVRSLYLNGKVHVYLGSHFDPELFTQIAKDMKQDRLPISTYYISNSLETRWIMDRSDPMTGMLLMMISMSNSDRGSAVDAQVQIENSLRELESNPGPLMQKIGAVQDLVTQYQMKASFLEVSVQPWQKLTAAVKNISFTPGSAILSTTLETAHLLGLQNSQYKSLGSESYATEIGRIEWDYNFFPTRLFEKNMDGAISLRAKEIYENMRNFARRTSALIQTLQP